LDGQGSLREAKSYAHNAYFYFYSVLESMYGCHDYELGCGMVVDRWVSEFENVFNF